MNSKIGSASWITRAQTTIRRMSPHEAAMSLSVIRREGITADHAEIRRIAGVSSQSINYEVCRLLAKRAGVLGTSPKE
jgi:hypothetical protein